MRVKAKSTRLIAVRLDAPTLEMLDRLSEPVEGNYSMVVRQAIRAQARGLTEAEATEPTAPNVEVAA